MQKSLAACKQIWPLNVLKAIAMIYAHPQLLQ